jgi:hypothetical protein
MSSMLNLLAYSKQWTLALREVCHGQRTKRTLYFRGRDIEITLFQQMIVDAIGRAEDMLCRELMWVEDVHDRSEVPLHSIVDDVTLARQGILFINKTSNGLPHGLGWMLERVLAQPAREGIRTQGHWRARRIYRIRRYLRRVDDF